MAGIEDDQIIQQSGSSTQFQWAFGEVKNNVTYEYDSDFVEECSDDSLVSLSSSELADDATSPSSASSMLFNSDDGPLYELSELMAQLPLKRGLSKFYHGKSESFGSLANLNNIQDLAKKGGQRSRRSKCKSQSQMLSPKGTIVKNKKGCCSSSLARSCLVSSLGEMSSILDTIVVD
ncbi:hypothetical protein HanHA300_Chr10g0381991 [Helianthus annuus]|nr:hypothetical protein HanHA300_Chr10g0381991 [Helianthus annuus]